MGLFGKGDKGDENAEDRSADAIEVLAARRRELEQARDSAPPMREDGDLPTVVATGKPDQTVLEEDEIPPGSGPVAIPANGGSIDGSDGQDNGEPAEEEAMDDDLMDLFKDEKEVNEELAMLAGLLGDVDIDQLRKEVQEVKAMLQRG